MARAGRIDLGFATRAFPSLQDYHHALEDSVNIAPGGRRTSLSVALVPSGMQTPEYAQRVLSRWTGPEQTATRVVARQQRELLLRDRLPTLHIVGQSAPKQRWIGADIMVPQLNEVALALYGDPNGDSFRVAQLSMFPHRQYGEHESMTTTHDVTHVHGGAIDRVFVADGTVELLDPDTISLRLADLGSFAALSLYGQDAARLVQQIAEEHTA